MADARIVYFYAEIEPDYGNECCGIHRSASKPEDVTNPTWIHIPVYDLDYFGKFYINGAWYEDAAGTIPWQSSLI